MGKSKVKEELNIPVMIFCIIGTVLVVLGFLLMKNNNFKLDIFSTTGTVSSVQIATNAEGVIESKTLIISYSAARGDYTATIYVTGDDTRQIGDQVVLYYDFLSKLLQKQSLLFLYKKRNIYQIRPPYVLPQTSKNSSSHKVI